MSQGEQVSKIQSTAQADTVEPEERETLEVLWRQKIQADGAMLTGSGDFGRARKTSWSCQRVQGSQRKLLR